LEALLRLNQEELTPTKGERESPMTNEVLAEAMRCEARGWSVLPLCPHNHLGVGRGHRGCSSPGKRPFFPDRPEGSQGEWKEFQSRRATTDEIEAWWGRNQHLNLGVALGPVSGLVGIDVDHEDGERLLEEMSGGDIPQTWEYTTGKGRRLLYRLPPGVTVQTQAFTQPGAEVEILRLMSTGSQVVLPPSTHPNKSVYRWKALHGPDDIPAADVPEWMRGQKKQESKTRPVDGELITEGGRNNYLTTVAGCMRRVNCDEDTILVTLTEINEKRLDPPLPEAEVRTIARSVARYEPEEFSGVSIKMPDRLPPIVGDDARRFKWASELSAPPRADEWLWKGYLPKSGITLLSALWKAGKTTLLAHLLRALATDGEFLGQPIRASRVLYVSEEGEQHWVRRRDDLGFGDHAAFYLQPFASKPDAATWAGFIAQLVRDIQAHKFDLIVFDTLAKLWPVAEENDAGSVDAALMPLWELTKAGAGVLLIHHLRKSGGQEYTGSRGSGALSAFPDIIVELTRFDAANSKEKKRRLCAKGRYEETLDELVIELKDGRYVHVPAAPTGVPAGADGVMTVQGGDIVSEEQKIMHVFTTEPDVWLQIEDIRVALRNRGWGMRNKDLNTHLMSLWERKQVVIRGILRSKAEPRQYAAASRLDLFHPQDAGGNGIWEQDGEEGGPDLVP
jgi:bifunctional DNA primase/polymerase-like protein/AAA domain-containing protein/primase-like protein